MSAPNSAWTAVAQRLPPEGVTVETKIDDEHGCRSEVTLKRVGRLWLHPDGRTYVYYVPTHWRHIERYRA